MVPWNLFYASFFAVFGLWVTFGPARLMASAPRWAATSLALSSLAYFVALPAAQWTWRRIGFAPALIAWGGPAALGYAVPALHAGLLPFAFPVAALAASGAYGLTENYLIEALGAQDRAHEFGTVRRWGSFGFLAAAAGGGVLLDALGGLQALERVLAVAGLGFGASCVSLARAQARGELPYESPASLSDAVSGDLEPVPVRAGPIAAGDREDGTPARWFGRSRWFDRVRRPLGPWLFGIALFAIVLHRTAESQATAWFGALWINRGHSPTQAGLLGALPVACEFLAMGVSAPWLARLDTVLVMLTCSAISAVRWWLTPACEDFACAAAFQSLHAISFGLFYPASLLWLRAQRPLEFFRNRYVMEAGARAAGSGYYFLAAGTLIPLLGYDWVYRIPALIAVVAVLLWAALPWLAGRHRPPPGSAHDRAAGSS